MSVRVVRGRRGDVKNDHLQSTIANTDSGHCLVIEHHHSQHVACAPSPSTLRAKTTSPTHGRLLREAPQSAQTRTGTDRARRWPPPHCSRPSTWSGVGPGLGVGTGWVGGGGVGWWAGGGLGLGVGVGVGTARKPHGREGGRGSPRGSRRGHPRPRSRRARGPGEGEAEDEGEAEAEAGVRVRVRAGVRVRVRVRLG